jgi:hypothetical protein
MACSISEVNDLNMLGIIFSSLQSSGSFITPYSSALMNKSSNLSFFCLCVSLTA